ncbi:hypothetical protein MTO96_021432 [Rhipicephalus appendiculatus]
MPSLCDVDNTWFGLPVSPSVKTCGHERDAHADPWPDHTAVSSSRNESFSGKCEEATGKRCRGAGEDFKGMASSGDHCGTLPFRDSCVRGRQRPRRPVLKAVAYTFVSKGGEGARNSVAGRA